MKKLSFNPAYEVMFDYRGVTDLQSGTAPHNPVQARVVVRNVETTVVSKDEDAECSAAAAMGQAALNAWVLKNYKGGDERAERNLSFAVSE